MPCHGSQVKFECLRGFGKVQQYAAQIHERLEPKNKGRFRWDPSVGSFATRQYNECSARL